MANLNVDGESTALFRNGLSFLNRIPPSIPLDAVVIGSLKTFGGYCHPPLAVAEVEHSTNQERHR